MTTRKYTSRSQQTTITSSVTSGASSITVASSSAILGGIAGASITGGVTFTIVIDPDTALEEILDVTGVSGTVFTVSRNIDGSTAQDHSAGAIVRHMVIGRDLREPNTHIETAVGVHGIASTSSVVGTQDSQTLYNKTLVAPTLTSTLENDAGITFEGATADAFETLLTVVDPTQDNTITLPNTSGTIDLLDSATTLTNKTITSPIINGTPVITGLSSAGMSTSSATPKSYVDAILVLQTAQATAAATSAASAATSATAAATSATSAAASATAAATSATSSAASATTAAASVASIATYASNALASQNAASTSATSAAASATAAATSATSAAASATTASNSASTATTQAAAAVTSANSAATSATSAAASATTAAASVASIATYASNALTSQNAAATSATSAAASATAAATSASSAATSATSAAASATAIAGSTSAAATSASSSATSATAAATSATSAAASATAASTSATSANVSATAASTSASSALTSQTAAATSATSAAASATAAATSATSAAASATAAATSATSAATSASSAATTYTTYDARYLGSKSSAPTVDNLGGTLLVGATYWNSSLNTMYAWTGSAWSAISTYTAYTAPTLGSTPIASGTTYANVNGLTINLTTIPTSKTLVVTTDKLSVHAATTSAELAGVISDETGSGALVFGTAPTISNLTLTGTLTAGASSGTNGQYLQSTATGTQWATVAGYSAPTLGSTSIGSGATVTTIAGLTLTAPILTGTVTASGDITLSASGAFGSIKDFQTLNLMGAL